MKFLFVLLSYMLAFVLTPVVIALSWRIGAVDVPLDGRRMHYQSIPRAGGIAIYAAFLIPCLAMGGVTHTLAVVLAGGLLMLLVGLADDVFCLGAWCKFFFQVAVALSCVLAIGSASPIDAVSKVFWVLALTNAHNFIDGLDGLFAGCAAIEGAALFLALALGVQSQNALPVLLLAAACLGFRYFNRYPAEVFAGDCGSATVGFLFGLLSLPLFGGQASFASQLAPLFVFAYPLTDLFAAIARRTVRGKSIFTADRGHLHHRLCDAGLMHPQSVGVLILLSAGASAVGVLLCMPAMDLAAAFALAALAFLLMRIRRFVEEFR